MEPVTIASDMWGVIGMLVVTGGGVLSGWLTMKAKRGSDKEDQDAAPVIAETEQQRNLEAVVDTLVEQMAGMQAELRAIKPIAHVKYPLSLTVISQYQRMHPESDVSIPVQIRGDL